MRSAMLVVFPVLFLCDSANAGDIFRCIAASGEVMYTNMACPAQTRVEHVASYAPVPPSPPEFAADVAAAAAAASAREAREAAEQARAAAYQAQLAAERAPETEGEPTYASDGYADWLPYYPVYYGRRFHDHRPPRHVVIEPGHRPHVSPHVSATVVAMHR